MDRDMARGPLPKTQTYLKYGFVITEHDIFCCPNCKRALDAGPNYQPRYCDQCGQRVTFEGTEWRGDRKKGYADGGGSPYEKKRHESTGVAGWG